MQRMLATDLCRLILRDQPGDLLSKLQQWSVSGDEIIISSITYAELIAGAMLSNDQARHMHLVREFCERLDAIAAWGSGAVDAYSDIQMQAMLAAHALSLKSGLLTLSSKNLAGIDGLELQLWGSAR